MYLVPNQDDPNCRLFSRKINNGNNYQLHAAMFERSVFKAIRKLANVSILSTVNMTGGSVEVVLEKHSY